MNNRFSKHRYDVKKRPDNSELAGHFHENHKETDMEVYILQNNLLGEQQREFFEDKWICRLQTLTEPCQLLTNLSTDLVMMTKAMNKFDFDLGS